MPLTLTVLGTATPYPLPDRPCSGYLLRAGGTSVAVDLGPGTLARLQRYQPLPELSALWLSHLHIDHVGDLPSLYYALAHGGLRVPAPVVVYAPRALAERLTRFCGKPDASFLDGFLEIRDLHDGHTVELGDLRLTSRAVEHGIEAYGLRAEYSGSVLAYSGDCGPCAGLDALADGADLLLCESDLDTLPAGSAHWHHTPEDAGALASRARVDTLLVTHVGPSLTREAATARAAAAFGGRTLTAREDETHRAGER